MAGTQVWHVGLQRAVTVVHVDHRNQRVRVAAGGLERNAGQEQLRAARPSEHAKVKRNPGTTAPQDDVRDDDFDPDDTSELRSERWSCDLRGLRVEEALNEVDLHIDRAMVANARGVCLIHGMGTGALRKAVQEHVSQHPQVAHQRLGQQGEGGTGVTMAWLKR